MPFKPPLVILSGPTAAGKSRLALHLAEKMNGEIISADSRQIYRGLDIGTAKPSQDELNKVPHHLLDILDPDKVFSAYDYQEIASKTIHEILSRGKLPLLVGGTGLYIRAVLDGFDFPSEATPELKEELEQRAAEMGTYALHQDLQKVDPVAASRIHPHDLFRIMRALEVYHATGKPISSQREKKKEPNYNFVYFCLTDDRQKLYDRINARVLAMMDQGLLEETRRIVEKYGYSLPVLKTIGYKELIDYLRGEYSLERAVELIQQHTRNYAKRQLIWFRRDPRIIWLDWQEHPAEKEMIDKIQEILFNKTIVTG